MSPAPRILVAGIGNLFFGDDGFGCEVARRLARRPLPPTVHVADFGIRGLDLAYALLDPYDAAVLVDATARGGAPGTLYVIDPSAPGALDPPLAAAADLSNGHGMHPARAIAVARAMGPVVAVLRLVGCEPASLGSEDDLHMELSPPVLAAVEPAVALVETLVRELLGSPVHESRHA